MVSNSKPVGAMDPNATFQLSFTQISKANLFKAGSLESLMSLNTRSGPKDLFAAIGPSTATRQTGNAPDL